MRILDRGWSPVREGSSLPVRQTPVDSLSCRNGHWECASQNASLFTTFRPRGNQNVSQQVVSDALNEQLAAELASWYSYLDMSAWCSQQQLHGCAGWLRAQAQEEYTHAMKIYEFLLDRNVPVVFKNIEPPGESFHTIVDVFESALKQEKENTQRIDSLFQLAMEKRAFASLVELQWFITEQVEEEKTARANLTRVKMVSEDPAAILDFDNTLSERTLPLDTSAQ